MDKEELKRLFKDGKELLNELFDYINSFDSRIESQQCVQRGQHDTIEAMRKKQKALEDRVDELHAALGVSVHIIEQLRDRIDTAK